MSDTKNAVIQNPKSNRRLNVVVKITFLLGEKLSFPTPSPFLNAKYAKPSNFDT
jgi:hypothetical protein